MLTQTTEYALRALLYLGRLAAEERASVASIARATGVPAAYLAKVLQTLAARGWVESRIGRTGGFALLAPMRGIRVGDLIELFGGSASNRVCLLGNGPCDPGRPCTAHVRWSGAQRTARAALGELTLSELLDREADEVVIAAAPSIGGHTTFQTIIEEAR